MRSAERDVVTDVQPFALGFSYGWPLTEGKLLNDISGKRNKPEGSCFWNIEFLQLLFCFAQFLGGSSPTATHKALYKPPQMLRIGLKMTVFVFPLKHTHAVSVSSEVNSQECGKTKDDHLLWLSFNWVLNRWYWFMPKNHILIRWEFAMYIPLYSKNDKHKKSWFSNAI